MNSHIKLLSERAARLGVSDIANIVLDDPRFATWSASSHPHQHHYGAGMLARHTWEVVNLCSSNHALSSLHGIDYSMPTEQETFLAALYHDSGKMDDYEPYQLDVSPDVWVIGEPHDEWRGTPHKRLIHHISRSAIIWSRAVDRYPVYRGFEEAILHAILAHHGQRAWGSPVAPKSRLAWLLHLCDCLSARMNDADTLDVVKHYEA